VVICAEDVEDCDVKVETLPFKDKEGAAKSWNARSDAHLLRSLRELLREYSDKHDCRICVGDDGCDLCKRTDAALTEAAALELQKEQSK
jgi:hypothetical protein